MHELTTTADLREAAENDALLLWAAQGLTSGTRAWTHAGAVAGVTAHPDHGRGRGHAEAACRLVLDSLLRRTGRAALMVDADNQAAIRLYRRLGLHWRDVSAAALAP